MQNVLVTSDPTFESDIYGRESLVLLDFWAPWCAPCRTLIPILEKLAGENQDWITLIKVNTDECPVAAGTFGIQGIPAVFAVLEDQVIDQTQGAIPEIAVRQWLDRLKPRWQVTQLNRLFATEPEQALAQLRTLVELQPNDAALKLKFAERLFEHDQVEQAQQCLDDLQSRGYLEPEALRLKARIFLLSLQLDEPDIARLRQQIGTNSQPYGAKLQLAGALASRAEFEESCQLCLQLVAEDRKKTGEKARELMIEIFRVLPDESDLTANYRRKLASALY